MMDLGKHMINTAKRHSQTLSKMAFDDACAFAVDGSDMPSSELHGELHWRAVATQGLQIARICKLGQRGWTAAALFGMFHDCRRENDADDPEHGARGAHALITCSALDNLNPHLMACLHTSMTEHDHGMTTSDPLVGIGWDADRSLLTRVGIVPSFAYFSVLPGEAFEEFIIAGYTATDHPLSWDEIYDAAFL